MYFSSVQHRAQSAQVTLYNNLLFSKRRSIVGVSSGIKNIIDVSVMTGLACCYAGLRCLCQTRHVHWSFHLLCNCRVGMTYVRIVPSFITHSQLLATTLRSVGGEISACWMLGLLRPPSGEKCLHLFIILPKNQLMFCIFFMAYQSRFN